MSITIDESQATRDESLSRAEQRRKDYDEVTATRKARKEERAEMEAKAAEDAVVVDIKK